MARGDVTRTTETLDLTEVLAVLETWRRVVRLTTANGRDAHRRCTAAPPPASPTRTFPTMNRYRARKPGWAFSRRCTPSLSTTNKPEPRGPGRT
jgi:hypothetical protein